MDNENICIVLNFDTANYQLLKTDIHIYSYSSLYSGYLEFQLGMPSSSKLITEISLSVPLPHRSH